MQGTAGRYRPDRIGQTGGTGLAGRTRAVRLAVYEEEPTLTLSLVVSADDEPHEVCPQERGEQLW